MNLNRRQLLRGLAGGTAALGLAPAWARGSAATPAVRAFASSFDAVPEGFGPTRVAFDRALPAGLSGTLYRNGPARMRRGDTAYRHWFDGDGMVQAFRLQGRQLLHHGRMVQTERAKAEAQAGRLLWYGFGTPLADARSVSRPDDVNVGNISVLPLPGELLALWEAGSAWRLDPDTLRTKGRAVLSAETDGLSFSAHPRVDPDGRIWNFGYLAGSGRLVLYDLDRRGTLQRTGVVEVPNADMVHDFAVTERHLVFVLSPVLLRPGSQPAGASFMQRLQWRGDRPSWLVLVDKNTLEVTHRAELPTFFSFHLGNAWQDGRSVRVEVIPAAPFDTLMRVIEQATTGQAVDALPTTQPFEIHYDLDRRQAQLHALPLRDAEFPRWDARRTGQRSDHLLTLTRGARAMPGVFGFDSVTLLDRARQRVQHYSYGTHTLAEEHVLVPRTGGAQGEGWVLGTSYDWRAGRTQLSVFDARRLEDGPLAVARLPYALPLGLHGQSVAAMAG